MTIELYDSLDGQIALVTGATRGIGAAIAAELADLGATVYAGARDVSDITAAEQKAIQLDVTEEAEIRAALDRIREETGRLDIAVNNAGIFPESGPIHEMNTEELDRTLAVNLRGPALVAKHAIPLLKQTDGGRVVNLSSGLGRFTENRMGDKFPPYRLSKVGLGGLTAYLHAEYSTAGLLANAVSPGWVETNMGGSEAPRAPKKGAETPVWLSRFRPGNPSGCLWKDKDRIDW